MFELVEQKDRVPLAICHENSDRLAVDLQRCICGKEAREWRIGLSPKYEVTDFELYQC